MNVDLNVDLNRPASFFLFSCLLTGIAHPVPAQTQSHPKPSASHKGASSGSAFQAAFAGDVAKLKRLFPNGTDINIQDKAGKTLLHYAVLGGRTDVVRWLVARKIEMNAKDASGATALTMARRNTDDAELANRRADIITFLQERGAQETIEASPPNAPPVQLATVQQSVQKPASPLGNSATATVASLLGKERSVIEKVWGQSTTIKPRSIGVYDTVRGFEFVRVVYGSNEDGTRQSIAYVWLVPEGEGKQWHDVLKLAGFKTNGVRLEGEALKGVPGLPSYFHAIWRPYSDGTKKSLLLTAVSG